MKLTYDNINVFRLQIDFEKVSSAKSEWQRIFVRTQVKVNLRKVKLQF